LLERGDCKCDVFVGGGGEAQRGTLQGKGWGGPKVRPRPQSARGQRKKPKRGELWGEDKGEKMRKRGKGFPGGEPQKKGTSEEKKKRPRKGGIW